MNITLRHAEGHHRSVRSGSRALQVILRGRTALVLATAAVMAAGCAQFKAPYGERVQQLDLTPRNLSVAIQISAPQIFKREALINERRDELRYLKGQLSASETIAFSPELLRDIETVSTLSAQLGLSFDAGIKKQAVEATQLSDLQNQISVTRLQAQLAQLQRDVQLLQAGFSAQLAPSSPIGTATTAISLPTLTAPALPGLSAIATAIKDLSDRLDKASIGPRQAAAAASPIDIFRDRQAYRRVLQSAINSVTLDDLHDFDGRSLFRLQFQATVLPGTVDIARSLGVLKMRVRPPTLAASDSHLRDLYLEWLDHVTHRMNEAFRDGAFVGDPALIMLGSMNQSFSIVTAKIPANGDKACNQRLVIGPELGVDEHCVAVYFAVPPLSEPDTSMASIAPGSSLFELIRSNPASRRVGCRAARVSTGQLKLLTASLLASHADLTLADLRTLYAQIDAARAEPSCNEPNPAEWVPSGSMESLFAPTGNAWRAKGQLSTYGVTPVELAQRVSTAARAANALQIAAAVSAVLPTNGVGGNASIAYGRASEARVDAMERLPLVVGFSDPGDTANEVALANAGFGWVLGPRLVVDSKQNVLALEHSLSAYDLTADLVMPGWWPYFEIDYEAVWAPDLANAKRFSSLGTVAGQVPAASAGAGSIRVPRRHNTSDLDGVSSLVLNHFYGRRVEVASIARVEPRSVSGCAKKVTLLVQGTNIWRSETAYLSGLQSTELSVLPDMTGVSVTFDLSDLPQRPSHFVQPKLTLSTPAGIASVDVEIDGSRLSAKQCGDEASRGEPKDDGAPSISAVFPSGVYACDTKIRLVIKGKHLQDAREVYIGPLKARFAIVRGELHATLDAAIGNAGGSQATLPVIVTTGHSTTSAPISVERDECGSQGKPSTTGAFKTSLLLVPTPTGRFDICSKQATLLLAGPRLSNYDGAVLMMTKPKAATIPAQSFKLLPRQNIAEMSFVGLPSAGADASSVDSSVQVQLVKGDVKMGEPIAVDVTCSGTGK